MSTFHLRSFVGGRDLRPGLFAGKDKDRFKELTNYYTGKDRKLHRRPPVKQVSGTLSANAQGLVILNGNLVQIAKKGDVVTNTIVSPAITTLRFDNPDHCTTWQLIQAKVYNGNIVALIRHTYPGGAVTSRIFLHVFDGALYKPTYVEDPFCPTSWAPRLPVHAYRTVVAPDVIGAFADYNPRMCIAAQKLHISGPDGNLYFSRVKNARVWNTRSVGEIQDQGEWWYFVTNSTVGMQEFIISESHATLVDYSKFAGFVLEYLSAAGVWTEFIEDAAAPPVVHAHWAAVSVASRFAGGPNELKAQVFWTSGGGTILRFRACLKSDVTVSSVAIGSPNLIEAFNGTGAATVFNCATIQSAHLPDVYVGGVLQTLGVNYTFTGPGPLAQITFSVAPPLGTGNVQVARGAIMTFTPTGGILSWQSGEVARRAPTTSLILPTTPPTKEYLYGASWDSGVLNIVGTVLNVTDQTVVLPLGSWVGGQGRLHTLHMRRTIAASGTAPVALTIDQVYDYTASAFYKDRSASYLKWAGFGEAGFLATQSKNNTGGLIIDLSAVNATVIVYYAEHSQLWTIYTDQLLNRFDDDSDVGSGEHTGGTAVKFYNESVVLTARGLRAFGATSFNNDNLEDNNIGEPIEEFTGYEFLAGCFWSRTGELVCALDNGAATELHVFDYSKEGKISSWSKWESTALSRISRDGLIPLNGRLYYVDLTGAMFYFDQEATNRQFDLTATPYTSTVRWPLLDFDHPGLSKDYLTFGMAAQGTWSIAFNLLTNDVEIEVPGPVWEGSTYGKGHVDMGMEGQALGVVIRSTGAPTDSGITDSVIEAVQIDYTLVRR